jgi:hypothetical protein
VSDSEDHLATAGDRFRVAMKAPWNAKDVSDWLKIIAMLAAAFFAYQRLIDRVDTYGQSLDRLERQTMRIERYLSTKDPDYWQRAKSMDDP